MPAPAASEPCLYKHVDDPAGARRSMWYDRITNRDLSALGPLLTQHINPYARFELDMDTRIALEG